LHSAQYAAKPLLRPTNAPYRFVCTTPIKLFKLYSIYCYHYLRYPNHGFSGWEQAPFTYTAHSSSEVLKFLATNAPTGVPPTALLDGVSLVDITTPVPEPEEWAMMLVGAGLVSFQVGRKQAKVTV
jgi:hypothetical protein